MIERYPERERKTRGKGEEGKEKIRIGELKGKKICKKKLLGMKIKYR